MATTDSTPATDVQTYNHLTNFQQNILKVIASLTQAGRKQYGLNIKRGLEGEYYGEEINHGRLYPNLKDLADIGLIQIGQFDRRTKQYTLTERGKRVARAGMQKDLDLASWLLDEQDTDAETASDSEA